MHYFMMIHNDAFAWDSSERGHFWEDFFPPVDIPVIPHKPWVQHNIPIPPGLYEKLRKVVKQKLDTGVFVMNRAIARTPQSSHNSTLWSTPFYRATCRTIHWLCLQQHARSPCWIQWASTIPFLMWSHNIPNTLQSIATQYSTYGMDQFCSNIL